MPGVLEKRREYLRLMRKMTLEKGHFTIQDIAVATGSPRSTVQDWVNRLVKEKCVVIKEEKRGRAPARYISGSAVLSSACHRIFTTTDDDMVAIYHECRSRGCAAFCAYHHTLAEGALRKTDRDGTLLLEYASLGFQDAHIGLMPSAAVGVLGVRREDGHIVQTIRCIGGPAYSLTDMMGMAEGVCDIQLKRKGQLVEGEVKTMALTHLIIGVDDTDTEEGGATFALALGLLQYMGKLDGVIPIGHSVAMLYPHIRECTAGNSCSFIELAVLPAIVKQVMIIATRFVADESLSPDWGVAIKEGFIIPSGLRSFARDARAGEIGESLARKTAGKYGVMIEGGRGITGALAAVALRGESTDVLLNPTEPLSI